MEKRLFVLWKAPEVDIGSFRVRLVTELAPALLALGPESLTVNVADIEPEPTDLVRGDGATVAGLVSVTTETGDETAEVARILDPTGLYVAGYAVRELVARRRERKEQPDGEVSPGAKQVMLLRRRPGLAYDEFLQLWQRSFTPLALETHPLSGLVNNVVEAAVTSGAPHYDGIVEMYVNDKEDILDPMRFFGSRENIDRVLDNLKTWVDFRRLELHSMSEIVMKSSEREAAGDAAL